jgi:hypothetical protein
MRSMMNCIWNGKNYLKKEFDPEKREFENVTIRRDLHFQIFKEVLNCY